MPKISVIIPVYNVEKYLAECLDSVLNQTFQDIEIICVNDGSTDNCGKILDKYAKKDPRIQIITQKNKGLSGARNTGLDIATGDWICFVDSDDALPPNALSVLYSVAEKSGCQIVASRERLSFFSFEKTLKKTGTATYLGKFNKWNGIQDFVRDSKIYSSSCNKLFDSELFQTQRFKEGMLFEDWPIMTILFGRVDKYATTDVPCYVYREDNTSITRSSFSLKKLNSYIDGVKMVYQAYYKSDLLPYARKRMAVAVKMLVNKVYRDGDPKLARTLVTELNTLFQQKTIHPKDLVIKTRYRLWRLKHK